MTTGARTAANRRNAKRSTGPRSGAGKRRASRNAVRHGLAASLAFDPALAAEVERLAAALHATKDPLVHSYAVQVAEAELILLRVRHMRIAVIERIAASNEHESYSPEWFLAFQRETDRVAVTWPEIGRLRNAIVPLFRQTQRMGDPARIETTQRITAHTPDWDRHSWAFMTALPELGKLERYERRAFSRRRWALRLLAAAVKA